MIKRKPSKLNPSLVNDSEIEHLTATLGIREDLPVTDTNSVKTITNLELAPDGTLELRKPLISAEENKLGSNYLSDEETEIRFSLSDHEESIFEIYQMSETGTTTFPYILKITDINNKSFEKRIEYPYIIGNMIYANSLESIHIKTVTVLTDCTVDLKSIEGNFGSDVIMFDPDLINPVDVEKLYRYIAIYKREDDWIIEIINPEINTLTPDVNNPINLNPNLLLDNPYAIRDLYNYGGNSIANVLAYITKDKILPRLEKQKLVFPTITVNNFLNIFDIKYSKDTEAFLMYVKTLVTTSPFKELIFENEEVTPAAKMQLVFKSDSGIITTETITLPKIMAAGTCICDLDIPSANLSSVKISITQEGANVLYIYDGTVLTVEDLYKETPKKFYMTEPFVYSLLNLNKTSPLDDLGITLRKDTFGITRLYNSHPESTYIYFYTNTVSDADAYKNAFPYAYKAFFVSTEKTLTYNVNTYVTLRPISFANFAVKHLTESVSNIQYEILDTVNVNEKRQIILKAFVTTQKNSDNFYCCWEYSKDSGVSWEIVPEFVQQFYNDIKYISVVNYKAESDSLNQPNIFQKDIPCVPFSLVKSQNDLITRRPDILILDFPKFGYKYRFKIYRAEEALTNLNLTSKYRFQYNIGTNPTLKVPSFGTQMVMSSKLAYTENRDTFYIFVDKNILPRTDTLQIMGGSSKNINTTLSNDDCTIEIPSTVLSNLVVLTIDMNTLLESKLSSHVENCRILIKTPSSESTALVINFKYLYYLPVSNSSGYGLVAYISKEDGKATHHHYSGSVAKEYTFTELCQEDPSILLDKNLNIKYVLKCKLTNITSTDIPIQFQLGFVDSDTNIAKGSGTIKVVGNSINKQINITVDYIDKATSTDDVNGYLPGTVINYPTETIILPKNSSLTITYEYDITVQTAGRFGQSSHTNLVKALHLGFLNLNIVTSLGIINISKSTDWTKLWENKGTPTVVTSPEIVNSNAAFDGFIDKIYPVQNVFIKSTNINKEATLISEKEFSFSTTNLDTETLDKSKLPILKGYNLSYNGRIFTYGVKGHESTIYISDIDSYTTSLYNTIEIDYGYPITKLTPWRDYLLAFTTHSIHLIMKSEDLGFTSRIVNTNIGLPYYDRNTVVNLLNSVLFKSESKIYKMVPNLYSSADTIMNLKCISTPIESQIRDIPTESKAFSTDMNYYVFIPINPYTTNVLVYNHVYQTWTTFRLPIEVVKFYKISNNNLRVYNKDRQFIFNKALSEFKLPRALLEVLPYGDFLTGTISDITQENFVSNNLPITPIPFRIDFGQKSSNYNYTKQYLETKFSLGTLSNKDTFPFTVRVDTDGISRPITVDVNTDSTFWKTAKEQLGTLATSFTDDTSQCRNVIRQMFIKYSGQGRTHRHIIEGTSLSPFKFYSIDVKYRVLPKKQ